MYFYVDSIQTGKITPFNFSEAFKEWCFCQHELNKIRKQHWVECPCCTVSQHSSHVDGNCKLYRYRNSGKYDILNNFVESFCQGYEIEGYATFARL